MYVDIKMISGEELALNAMKKELARLQKIADKAKREADEYCHVGTEMLAIHKEFLDVLKSDKHDKETLDKLARLRERSNRADKIINKSGNVLFDKQFEAECNVQRLAEQISMLEFRISLRSRK